MAQTRWNGVAAALLAVSWAGGAAWAAPAVFEALSLDEARERSRETGRVLAVHATAVWCQPCKMMERDTWSDDGVVAWVREHGIAISVDVDDRKEEALALRIRAMPTVVLFVDGEEFERAVGFQGPRDMLLWLEGAREGMTRIEALAALYGDRLGPHGRVDVGVRRHVANELYEAGRFDEATEEYLWLWAYMGENMPQARGVRGPMILSGARPLIDAHAPARAAFRGLRDEAEAWRRDGDGSGDELSVWVLVKAAVGADARPHAGYERVRATPEGMETLGRFAGRVQGLLIREGRWAEYGAIIPDPVFEVRNDLTAAYARYLMLDADNPNVFEKDTMTKRQREAVLDANVFTGPLIYGACLAAGRDAEAAEVGAILIAVMGPGEGGAAMVDAAIRAGAARPEHRAVLEEASRAGVDEDRVAGLAARLEDALR